MDIRGVKPKQIYIQGNESFSLKSCVGFTVENQTDFVFVDEQLKTDANAKLKDYYAYMGINDVAAHAPLAPEAYRTFSGPANTEFVDSHLYLRTGKNTVLVTLYILHLTENEV